MTALTSRSFVKARPVELCQLAIVWNGSNHPETGCMAEQKIDGWRATYFRGRDGQPKLWTRHGHPIEATDHILHQLAAMEAIAGEPMVFDGEFQVDGCLSATKKHCESDYKLGAEAGTFFTFDCLTEREWRANDCGRPLIERKAMLQRFYDESLKPDAWEWRAGTHGREPDTLAVKIVPDTWVISVDDIMSEATRVWAAGGEGLMLKDAEAPYERARSKAWQKVKSVRYRAR